MYNITCTYIYIHLTGLRERHRFLSPKRGCLDVTAPPIFLVLTVWRSDVIAGEPSHLQTTNNYEWKLLNVRINMTCNSQHHAVLIVNQSKSSRVSLPTVAHPTGVVLTLTIPPVSAGTGTGTVTLKSPLSPMGSAHGHTGHVRFLTSIELPEGLDMKFPPTATADSTGRCPTHLDGGSCD